MTLYSEIAQWDGKSKADISAIHDRYAQEANFLEQLIDCLDDPAVQKGATWMIKRFIEAFGALDAKSTKSVLGKLSGLQDWESRLHMLQSLPALTIPAARKKQVETFLRQCIVADNTFVRAWAYGGFYEFARQYPAYREEAEQFMQMGMRDEPASVRARIRKVTAKGF